MQGAATCMRAHLQPGALTDFPRVKLEAFVPGVLKRFEVVRKWHKVYWDTNDATRMCRFKRDATGHEAKPTHHVHSAAKRRTSDAHAAFALWRHGHCRVGELDVPGTAGTWG